MTNNWNPDLDYGDEYVAAYFHIDTPSYTERECLLPSFSGPSASERWHQESSAVIASVGILEDCGFRVEHMPDAEKCAYLYAHPYVFSGVIKKNDVRKVAEAIDAMELSSIRFVELYDTYYHLSDEEYEKYLTRLDDAMKKELFQKCQTKRKDTFRASSQIAVGIAKKFLLKRLGKADELTYSCGPTITHLEHLIDTMNQEGSLVVYMDGDKKLVRSINKAEQKKFKLDLSYMVQ